jgi:phosphate starvation-inducible PhoH-like protein
MNKKKNKKALEKYTDEELDYYLDKKKINDFKYYNENYEYISPKEKIQIDNKFTKPRNISQKKYMEILNDFSQKIVIATGPAGSGKTLLATEMGIKNFLEGKYEKLIFVRPAITTDEDIGFLPGTLEDKLGPFIRPLYDILYNYITPQEVKELIDEKIIEIAPLAYMRGRTFKKCWIIADEMQNSSISQMKMMLTRLGEGTRLIITGDLEQNDRHDEINGLQDFLFRFKNKTNILDLDTNHRTLESITSLEFNTNDIERSEVVKEVLNIYNLELKN